MIGKIIEKIKGLHDKIIAIISGPLSLSIGLFVFLSGVTISGISSGGALDAIGLILMVLPVFQFLLLIGDDKWKSQVKRGKRST